MACVQFVTILRALTTAQTGHIRCTSSRYPAVTRGHFPQAGATVPLLSTVGAGGDV